MEDTDLLLVERAGTSYKLETQNMSNLLDTDLLLVERAGVSYKVTADQVNTGPTGSIGQPVSVLTPFNGAGLNEGQDYKPLSTAITATSATTLTFTDDTELANMVGPLTQVDGNGNVKIPVTSTIASVGAGGGNTVLTFATPNPELQYFQSGDQIGGFTDYILLTEQEGENLMRIGNGSNYSPDISTEYTPTADEIENAWNPEKTYARKDWSGSSSFRMEFYFADPVTKLKYDVPANTDIVLKSSLLAGGNYGNFWIRFADGTLESYQYLSGMGNGYLPAPVLPLYTGGKFGTGPSYLLNRDKDIRSIILSGAGGGYGGSLQAIMVNNKVHCLASAVDTLTDPNFASIGEFVVYNNVGANEMLVDSGSWLGADGSGDADGKTVVTGAPLKASADNIDSLNGNTLGVSGVSGSWRVGLHAQGAELTANAPSPDSIVFTSMNAGTTEFTGTDASLTSRTWTLEKANSATGPWTQVGVYQDLAANDSQDGATPWTNPALEANTFYRVNVQYDSNSATSIVSTFNTFKTGV